MPPSCGNSESVQSSQRGTAVLGSMLTAPSWGVSHFSLGPALSRPQSCPQPPCLGGSPCVWLPWRRAGTSPPASLSRAVASSTAGAGRALALGSPHHVRLCQPQPRDSSGSRAADLAPPHGTRGESVACDGSGAQWSCGLPPRPASTVDEAGHATGLCRCCPQTPADCSVHSWSDRAASGTSVSAGGPHHRSLAELHLPGDLTVPSHHLLPWRVGSWCCPSAPGRPHFSKGGPGRMAPATLAQLPMGASEILE